MTELNEPAPVRKLNEYKVLKAEYEVAVDKLAEFGAGLIGYTVLFRRGSVQVVLAEVIGAKGSILTIRNTESDASYFIDLTKSEIVKIGNQYTLTKELP